ncbi:MAG TPA: primosomal protein N' [Casimicrobiaceae bacterium]|nr:primosomal protein N' [Casimicrobiaceae bacterium]
MAIVRVALPVATDQLFDYWLPAGLAIETGSVLRVRLAKRRMLGIALEQVDATPVALERLAPVDEILTTLPPLPADLCALGRFVSEYYQQPIGQCLALMLPPLGTGRGAAERPAARYRLTPAGRIALARLDAKPGTRLRQLRDAMGAPEGAATIELRRCGAHAWRTFADWRRNHLVEPVAPPPSAAIARNPALNADQNAALAGAFPEPSAFAPSLLQGVTGSGKTEVYFAAAARAIAAGRQALLLVPEINLTPQLEARIAAAFPGVATAVLHSGLPDAERLAHWRAAARGEARLVVGTRLAVFAPLPELGLIVVDEEHDSSFKQQDGVRYHARDVAVYRARMRDVPVILGSATPALESYASARRGRYRWLKLPRRAIAGSTLPAVRLVPNRAADSCEGLGLSLRERIAERLARREQTLLFINRRGFAPSLLCVACGWKAMCPRCTARLVVHRDAAALRCHHCGHAEAIPQACPACGNQDLLPLGFGTQRLERALAELYPAARLLRVDRDSTRRKGAFAAMQRAIASGEVDILVGTQMLAKGHDFPRLTLVGVLGADNALYSADFRATERLFAVLEQVAGRAGRAHLPGEVLVQTDFPDHPLYAALTKHDYDDFAESLLAEREPLGLPPFAHLALLNAEAPQRALVSSFLEQAAEKGRALLAASALRCELYPPVAAGLARRAGLERGQVLVHSAERAALQEFLPRWRVELEGLRQRRVRWDVDVDPLAFA